MRKFLLILVSAFIASFAIAQESQEIPVVTSVEELYAFPLETVVEFQDIEVVIKEVEQYGYINKEYYLADGETVIGGSVWPIPAGFTAVGYVYEMTNYDETVTKTFYVQEVKSVSKFESLNELMNFADYNTEVVANSSSILVKNGYAVCTYIDGDYAFYYTKFASSYGGGYNYLYGVMKVANANELSVGCEISGWCDGGTFKGSYRPAVEEYDEDYNLVGYQGALFTIDEDCMLWSGYDALINYTPTSFIDLAEGYVYGAQPCRLAPGAQLIEEEGKYYLVGTYTVEEMTEDYEWIDVTYVDTIEVASNQVDLSQYAGTTVEDYICGVYDYSNTSDANRFLISKFIGKVDKLNNIAEYLDKGEQMEEEIITEFVNPLKVTYKYDDENYMFVLAVEDETGALTLDFSSAVAYDEETGEPTPEYAALKNIQPGDMLTDVKGYAQFVVRNVAPRLACALEIWDSSLGMYGEYVPVVFTPTIESSGAEVKSTMVVTVEDMLNEWNECSENSTMPKIANKVVTVLDAQVIDSLVWGDNCKFLVQGKDTMELSNLWGERGFNFTTYERNNIVGIADYCSFNGNYVYQLMPLSQEHITDASIVPEVESIEELADYVGLPVILKNAEIQAISAGWFADYFLQDGETYVYGLTARGKYDLQGIYEMSEDGNTFSVYSVEKVHGFEAISDMNSYMTAFGATDQAYEVYSEAIVTYVDGENVFVQYDALDSYGMSYLEGNILMGVKTAVKIGDAIKGIKGVSTPKDAGLDENWEPYFNDGARFVLADDAQITVVSSDNEVEYSETLRVYYFVGYNEGNYSGQAFRIFGGGKILKEEGKYYYEETMVDEKEDEATVTRVEVASNVINLEEYVDQTISADEFILGVYNVGNTTTDARIFYITGFESSLLEYETIADFYAAGEVDYNFTSAFLNPLTVTYVHPAEYGGGSVFVQDETGGLRIDFYTSEAMAHIKVGDQLTGVRGMSSFMSFYGMIYLGGYTSDYKDYVYEVSGTAEPKAREITIPEFNAEVAKATEGSLATELVSDLVVVRNVSYETGTMVDQWGDEVTVGYLVDEDGNKLVLPGIGTASFEARGLTTYERMDVRGIVDNGGMNYNDASRVSLYPRSQEDIMDVTSVKGVEVNSGIYVDAANQVVANGAVAVVVYDINGRTVATANAATVSIDALAQGVYVVRATYADNTVATAKVVR